MNKLKALIMEDKIMIEKKGQDAITVENIAWFIMSSNENKPVHLDNKDSGNRRFSIIKT
jgi:phage/plasmid-associated DNA primase